jgi:putative ABC transport system permease protein
MMKGREEETFLLQTSWVDGDFLDTYGMEMSLGEFFDEASGTNEDACIVNETAVNSYNMTDPFSVRFINHDDETDETTFMPVVGVVKDFHHESLQREITPFMFRYRKDFTWGYISLRLAPTASSKTIEEIEKVWSSFTGGMPMQYFFMDEDFDRLYKEERQNASLSILFTILGIFIAALGLYGLTSFTVQQRTREIGIRKVFGASIFRIWYLISKEIVILVIVSTVLAFPLVYWVADTWLQNYYYRISLGAGEFIFGFIVAIAIALLTTTYRTLRTAQVNPADSLRYE